MQQMYILIPPSEGKTPGGTHDPLGQLSPAVMGMYQRLMAVKGDMAAFYGLKDKALQQAQLANKAVLTSKTLPAIERYSGVVYDGIDYSTLDKKSQQFFNAHVRIVSALFGLLAPTDLIPDYKLKIEKLDAAKYWRDMISPLLAKVFIIDLLPQAHQKAVSFTQGVRVDFVISKNGKTMPAGHQGKLVKGKFVRWLCQHQCQNPKDFKAFHEDGFVFSEDLSNDDQLIFKLSKY